MKNAHEQRVALKIAKVWQKWLMSPRSMVLRSFSSKKRDTRKSFLTPVPNKSSSTCLFHHVPGCDNKRWPPKSRFAKKSKSALMVEGCRLRHHNREVRHSNCLRNDRGAMVAQRHLCNERGLTTRNDNNNSKEQSNEATTV